MVKKSDIVKNAVRDQEWKKALLIAKDFHIGVTQEQRSKMARAYECIVHPDFYQQIGVDIPEAIEQGKAVVKEYAERARRKDAMMKWDVKHDRAKRVIDAFLENAVYWQEREDLSAGLTEEDKTLVSGEVALMIASIRKRYKLQERLSKQEAQSQPKEVQSKVSTREEKEALPEPVNGSEKESKMEEEMVADNTVQEQEPVEKPKCGRKSSGTDKSPRQRKTAKKKVVKEENAKAGQKAAG